MWPCFYHISEYKPENKNTQKDRDDGNALNFIEKQLNESIPKNYYKDFIIAYEPIWAIGSGKIPTIDSINEMFLK